MPDTSNPRLQKRVDDHVCAACRKPFQPGQRVMPAYILLDPHARNPRLITEKGLELGQDNEFAHVRCEDPFLDGKLVLAT